LSKKSPFEPLTVGYDWEMAVLKKTTQSIGTERINELSNEIRNKIPWAQVGMDIDLLELRMGVISNWTEFKKKNRILLDVIKQVIHKKDLTLLPVGARPTEQMPIGSHIHIGTITDFTEAVRTANMMVKYIPCFVALGCNSPFSRFDMGEFKSYRIIYNAERCSFPNEIRIPELARETWGEDVSVKLPRKPTIEIRCIDSCSDFDLLEELVALLAGLLYGLSKTNYKIKEMREVMKWQPINRFWAAKYGLQATLKWHGEEKPVTEIFSEIFTIAREGMKIFGGAPEDLSIISKMINKRQTQADFLKILAKLDSDPTSLLRTIMNILPGEDFFKQYLKKAKKLKPMRFPSIEEFILSKITRDVPYINLYICTPLSPYHLNKVLTKLEKENKITTRISPYEGKLYSRTDIP
jgi:gamma-glutamyl:cysteine ligase YbdK (ATP-grasp superfamily)